MTRSPIRRSQFFVETLWLHKHLQDPNLRIVDADDVSAYSRAHIPGATSIPVHHYLKQRDGSSPTGPGAHVMSPDNMVHLMKSLGIDNGTHVVAYDHSRGLFASRFWWVLTYYGHRKVQILNGGWKKWFQEGRPITEASPAIGVAKRFKPVTDSSLIVSTETLKDNYDRVGVVVWDVRSKGEYAGELSRGNQRAGHIPGAINLEWLDLINAKDHTLKPLGEIQHLLERNGITPEKQVFIH